MGASQGNNNEESGFSIATMVIKWAAILLLVLLPLKMTFHPYEERPEVFCSTTLSVLDFLWIDVAGVIIFKDDPIGKLDAIMTVTDYRKSCKLHFKNSKQLNLLPLLD